MKSLLYTLCVLFNYQAFACSSVPQYYSRPYSEVILDSQSIFLAKVKSKKEIIGIENVSHNLTDLIENSSKRNSTKVRYEFEIIESFKGEKQSNYYEKLGSPPIRNGNGDFNGHTDYGFWLDSGGRLNASSDCTILPSFSVGNIYLIIEGERDSYKSYEEIVTENDAWLLEVKNILKMKSRKVH